MDAARGPQLQYMSFLTEEQIQSFGCDFDILRIFFFNSITLISDNSSLKKKKKSTQKTFKLYSLHKWDLLCFLLLDTYWDVESNSVTQPLQRPARCGIVQSLIQRS